MWGIWGSMEAALSATDWTPFLTELERVLFFSSAILLSVVSVVGKESEREGVKIIKVMDAKSREWRNRW
jgi:hypothetical protein